MVGGSLVCMLTRFFWAGITERYVNSRYDGRQFNNRFTTNRCQTKNLYSQFSMDSDFPLLGEKAYTSNIVMMGLAHERAIVFVNVF